MPGRLHVNTETIGSLSSNLGRIHRTLSSANTDSNDLAGMIPHERLAGVVGDFADQWDRRRADLTEQIDVLKQKARVTADAFQDVDGELGDAVEGEG